MVVKMPILNQKRANRVLSTLDVVGHDAMLSTAVRMVAENRRRDIAAFVAKEPVVGGISLLGGESEGGRRDANNTGYAPKVEMARMQQPRIFGRMEGFSRSALNVQTELGRDSEGGPFG